MASLEAKRMRINSEELRTLRVQCSGCNTAVEFDGLDPDPTGDVKCPRCDSPMAGMHYLLRDFKQFLNTTRKAHRDTHFLVKVTD